MAKKGSYTWWRANYSTDADYLAVAAVLAPLGYNCDQVEVDHFPPNASYSGAFAEQLTYGNRPAFPLPKYLHRYRKGDGGMGGHASSTGSTAVQKGWTSQLSAHMASGSFYGAMRDDIIDKQNVAEVACRDRNLFNKLLKPAVTLAFEDGLLSGDEYYHIMMNYLGGL